jgi:hypothetical protein
MHVGMGLIQKNGTWIVRQKVPGRLREPVSRVLGKDRQQQVWLQKSTRTKIKAEGLLAERPLRTTLTQQEVDRLADWHYANVLAADETFVTEGAAEDEALVQTIADQLTERLASSTIRHTPWDLHRPTGSAIVSSSREPTTWRAGYRR